MFTSLARSGLIRGAARVPGLRAIPIVKVIVVGEIALLAHSHVTRLDRAERKRFLDLMRKGRWKHGQHLTGEEREELAALVAKAEPRLFAGLAASKISPFPLPRRLVHGKRRH